MPNINVPIQVIIEDEELMAALEAERERSEALKAYVMHKWECWTSRSKRCTCGLAQLVPEQEYADHVR